MYIEDRNQNKQKQPGGNRDHAKRHILREMRENIVSVEQEEDI